MEGYLGRGEEFGEHWVLWPAEMTLPWAIAETPFTVCPAAALKLGDSCLILSWFSLGALQNLLPPAPCRECINMDDFNKSPCLLASRKVPPMSSTCKKPGAQRRRVGASITRTPSLPGHGGSAVSLHRRSQLRTAALPGVQYLLTLVSSLLLEGRVVLFLAVSLHSAYTFVSSLGVGFF